VRAGLQQALELRRAGRYNAARETVQASLAKFAGHAHLLRELGFIELDAERPEQAEKALAAAMNGGLDDGPLIVSHAAVLRQFGRPEQALDMLDAAITRHADLPALQTERGWILFEMHDYLGALKSFLSAIRNQPTGQRQTDGGGDASELPAVLRDRNQTALRGRRRARLRTGAGPTKRICRWADGCTRRAFDQWLQQKAKLQTVLASDSVTEQNCLYLQDFAWRKARLSAAEEILAQCAAVVWLLATLASSLTLAFVLAPNQHVSGAVTVPVFLVGLLMAIAGGLRILSLRSLRAQAVLLFTLACAVASAVIERDQASTLSYVVTATVGVTAAGTLVIYALVAPIVAASSLVALRLRRSHRKAAILAPLLDLLTSLEESQTSDRVPNLKREVELIEQAASACRFYLRHAADTGDRRNDAWMTERADGAAAAMRELKKRLLSPSGKGLEPLCLRVRRDIVAVAHEHWRDLPWLDPAPIATDRRRLLGLTILRNVVIGLTPLATLVALESTGTISLTGGVSGQVNLGVIAWALVTLLLTLDPELPQKLRIMKDALGTFRPDQSAR
jgi:hypothetical protein